MRSKLAAAIVVVVTTASTAALADSSGPGYTESKDISGQVVAFKDDPMDGTKIDPNGSILQGVHRAQRMAFMRPRLNFVTELYKSIEKM